MSCVNEAGVSRLGPGGCWIVTTASGSVHLFDFEMGCVTRLPAAEGREPDFPTADLRRDGEAVPLLWVGGIEVGEPLVMLVQVRADAVTTVRQTTPVVSVRRLPPEEPGPGPRCSGEGPGPKESE